MTKLIVSILISLSAATAQEQDNLPLGKIEVPDDVSMVVLNNDGRRVSIMGGTGTATQLPVGRFRVKSWTMERKDNEGNTWQLIGSDVGRKGVFDIVEDRATRLPVGEPVFSSLAVSRKDSTYRLNCRLTGQFSETVEITKNASRSDAPKVHITNPDGSYQETLAFEYG